MTRRSKKDRPRAIIQTVLANNMTTLRDRRYAELRTATARNKQLAKDADTSFSQIQRIISMNLAPGIDLLERIADALHTRPQDLITPYFANTQGNDVSSGAIKPLHRSGSKE